MPKPDTGTPVVGGASLSRLRVGRHGVVHVGPVEHIKELAANHEGNLLPNPECSRETEFFVIAALGAIVVVVSGRGAKSSVCGVGPRRRVQHELLVGIEAMAIEILREQGHARHTIRIGALERVSAQDVIRGPAPEWAGRWRSAWFRQWSTHVWRSGRSGFLSASAVRK